MEKESNKLPTDGTSQQLTKWRLLLPGMKRLMTACWRKLQTCLFAQTVYLL